jgi:hypothetical protein
MGGQFPTIKSKWEALLPLRLAIVELLQTCGDASGPDLSQDVADVVAFMASDEARAFQSMAAQSCNWHHEEHNAYQVRTGQRDNNGIECELVDAVGIEPTTCRLRVECSAS